MNDFEQLLSEGEAALYRWVQGEREEGLHLEFKTKASQDENPGKDDKKNLYVALSGFGNAEGGVVVWGVRTQRIGGTDKATSLAPFEQHDAFRGRLLDSIQNGVSPPMSAVEVVAIPSNKTPGAGYVAIKILPSIDRPHQAQGGEQRYYRRTSTGTRRMDGYEVRDMLLGRRLAKLVIEHTAVRTSRTANRRSFNLLLQLRNTAGIMTGYPYMVITEGRPMLRHFEPVAGVRQVHDSVQGTRAFYAAADIVVHAFDRIPFVQVALEAMETDKGLAFRFPGEGWQVSDEFPLLAFDVRHGAERASPETCRFELTGMQLSEQVFPELHKSS